MEKFDRLVYLFEKYLIIILSIFMMSIIAIEVFFRYVLNMTLMVGVQEIAKWAFVWMSALACSAVYYKRGHVAVEYFVDRFVPKRLHAWLDLAMNLFVLSFLVTFVASGYPYAIGQWHRETTSADLPATIVFISVPVAFTFMTVHCLAGIAVIVNRLRGRETTEDAS